MKSKPLELEDRSHHDKLHVDGMQETTKDKLDLCKEKIQNIIMNKLGIEGPAETEWCHSMGCTQEKKSHPHTIIFGFTKFKEK